MTTPEQLQRVQVGRRRRGGLDRGLPTPLTATRDNCPHCSRQALTNRSLHSQQAFEARVTPPPAPSPMEFELNAYSSHGLDSLFQGEALAYRPSPVGKDARRSTPVRADGYAAPSSLEERSAALSTLAMSHDHLEVGFEKRCNVF